MKKIIGLFLFLGCSIWGFSQANHYEISFENAVHHEAFIKASFTHVTTDTLALRMSRTSPGRYALHEFAKNVYAFSAFDTQGNPLKIIRPNPYEWLILGHTGEVHISYTLFANRGGGTYAQVDETHAHLNMPATFMYAPSLANRAITIDFKIREDLNWKIATQLPQVSGTTYTAPNLYYFMDSPTEISDHQTRDFIVPIASGKKDTARIAFALHHNGTSEELDTYFEMVKKIVTEEAAVFGELPNFDYGNYTFLACYVPNASGDGMEHRNSTILTSTRSLANGGMERNIGTVSHEFFHAWNVERLRPKSLEPFNFEAANMSGALWFAEGFTSYYTNLILCRAGIISPEKYISGLTGTFNYVWNSPALQFFNPIEMSYQAPFVDAATSVDPINRQNTFISYYSYGSVLGLALDLSLRKEGLNLDDYMKLVWTQYGKKEISYELKDLHNSLNDYAGKTFGDAFFNNFIYKSKMPNYKELLATVGVSLVRNNNTPYFGASVFVRDDGTGLIQQNTKIGSPAYRSGLDKGDIITAINSIPLKAGEKFAHHIEQQFKVGDKITVNFIRFGVPKQVDVDLIAHPNYTIHIDTTTTSKSILENRKNWLKVE